MEKNIQFYTKFVLLLTILGRVRLGYSGIRIYSGIYSVIYSCYSAPGSRIAGMEIQVSRIKNNSETNAYSHYSNYSYSGLIPNERALRALVHLFTFFRYSISIYFQYHIDNSETHRWNSPHFCPFFVYRHFNHSLNPWKI